MAVEVASDFARLPDCSPPQYGSLKMILCFPVCPICSVVELCNTFFLVKSYDMCYLEFPSKDWHLEKADPFLEGDLSQ